jgi:hypothetical protein
MSNQRGDLIDIGIADAPAEMLRAELAAMINRYHRAHPETPLAEILNILSKLHRAVQNKAESLDVPASQCSALLPIGGVAPVNKVSTLFNLSGEIQGEWLHSPKAISKSLVTKSAKKRATKGKDR